MCQSVLYQRNVEALDMVGQGTDGDEIDSRLSVLAQSLFGDSAAGFGFVAVVDAAHRLAKGVGVEVVEHDTIHTPVVKYRLKFVEVADFYFDSQVFVLCFQVVAGAVDSGHDASCKVDVVVLEHNHIVQADAMVGAAAAVDGIFLEQTHVGGCLAGVKKLGVKAFEHFDHTVGLGGDTRKALHEIECCTLGGKDAARMTVRR